MENKSHETQDLIVCFNNGEKVNLKNSIGFEIAGSNLLISDKTGVLLTARKEEILYVLRIRETDK